MPQPPPVPQQNAISDLLSAAASNWAIHFSRFLAPITQTRFLRVAEAYFEARIIHSSQLSGFSKGTFVEPGPKSLVALGYFMVALARGLEWEEERIEQPVEIGLPRQLPESLRELWAPLQPMCDASGVVLGPRGCQGAFTGLVALPESFPRFIPPEYEEFVARRLGGFIRRELVHQGVDWVEEIDRLQERVPCVYELLLGRTVDGTTLLNALPQLADLTGTSEAALWGMVDSLLPA